jgi:NADH dehydrogenase FAD-containing subunit
VPVIHSSKYRNLQSILGQGTKIGGKILVVGGQMSGVEIAGTIATHLSSAANSPVPSAVTKVEDYKVHHLVQQPAWVFPLYTSPMVGEPRWLEVDAI